MKKIDTHLHLIDPARFRYPWLAQVPDLQNRTYNLDLYREAAAAKEIDGSIFMEVDAAPDQSAEEARFFCRMCEQPENRLLGVVAAARPENDGFERQLDAIAHPALKGIRRVLHTQDDSLSQSSRFRTHVAALGARGLTFDLCVLARQLPVAIELVDACPGTNFILDHGGVPDIAAGQLEPWATQLRELARRPHVTCKLSGLVAYAKPGTVSAGTLRPWVERVLEIFGPARMIWGGDWPVCNLGSSLGEWADLSEELLSGLAETEREKIFSANARSVYRLN